MSIIQIERKGKERGKRVARELLITPREQKLILDWFVLLLACETARVESALIFSGLAPGLILAGVPAVRRW